MKKSKENLLVREKVITEIRNLNGKLFSAVFVKADGTVRKMTCRTGVSKGIVGGGYSHSKDKTRRNLTVWDMAKGQYRAIPINRLVTIKLAGRQYQVV